jgi:hypothetical protein
MRLIQISEFRPTLVGFIPTNPTILTDSDWNPKVLIEILSESIDFNKYIFFQKTIPIGSGRNWSDSDRNRNLHHGKISSTLSGLTDSNQIPTDSDRNISNFRWFCSIPIKWLMIPTNWQFWRILIWFRHLLSELPKFLGIITILFEKSHVGVYCKCNSVGIHWSLSIRHIRPNFDWFRRIPIQFWTKNSELWRH